MALEVLVQLVYPSSEIHLRPISYFRLETSCISFCNSEALTIFHGRAAVNHGSQMLKICWRLAWDKITSQFSVCKRTTISQHNSTIFLYNPQQNLNEPDGAFTSSSQLIVSWQMCTFIDLGRPGQFCEGNCVYGCLWCKYVPCALALRFPLLALPSFCHTFRFLKNSAKLFFW